MKKRELIILFSIIVSTLLIFGTFGYFIPDMFFYPTPPPTPIINRPADISEGLIAHWDFNEGIDNTLTDHIGNNNCTINGATWSTGLNYTNTTINGVLDFDGTDDFTEKHMPEDLQTLGEGSISLWFKVYNIPLDRGISPIFHYGDSMGCMEMESDNNRGLIIEVGHSPINKKSKRIYFTQFNDGCEKPSFCFDSRYPLFEGKWYHFVAVVGVDFNTGYLNGEEMVNRKYNFGDWTDSEFFADALSDEKLWIGKGLWGMNPIYFDGQIDDIRIYNKTLSSEEVNLLYGIYNNTLDTLPLYDEPTFVLEKYYLIMGAMMGGGAALLGTIIFVIVRFIKKRKLAKEQL